MKKGRAFEIIIHHVKFNFRSPGLPASQGDALFLQLLRLVLGMLLLPAFVVGAETFQTPALPTAQIQVAMPSGIKTASLAANQLALALGWENGQVEIVSPGSLRTLRRLHTGQGLVFVLLSDDAQRLLTLHATTTETIAKVWSTTRAGAAPVTTGLFEAWGVHQVVLVSRDLAFASVSSRSVRLCKWQPEANSLNNLCREVLNNYALPAKMPRVLFRHASAAPTGGLVVGYSGQGQSGYLWRRNPQSAWQRLDPLHTEYDLYFDARPILSVDGRYLLVGRRNDEKNPNEKRLTTYFETWDLTTQKKVAARAVDSLGDALGVRGNALAVDSLSLNYLSIPALDLLPEPAGLADFRKNFRLVHYDPWSDQLFGMVDEQAKTAYRKLSFKQIDLRTGRVTSRVQGGFIAQIEGGVDPVTHTLTLLGDFQRLDLALPDGTVRIEQYAKKRDLFAVSPRAIWTLQKMEEGNRHRYIFLKGTETAASCLGPPGTISARVTFDPTERHAGLLFAYGAVSDQKFTICLVDLGKGSAKMLTLPALESANLAYFMADGTIAVSYQDSRKPMRALLKQEGGVPMLRPAMATGNTLNLSAWRPLPAQRPRIDSARTKRSDPFTVAGEKRWTVATEMDVLDDPVRVVLEANQPAGQRLICPIKFGEEVSQVLFSPSAYHAIVVIQHPNYRLLDTTVCMADLRQGTITVAAFAEGHRIRFETLADDGVASLRGTFPSEYRTALIAARDGTPAAVKVIEHQSSRTLHWMSASQLLACGADRRQSGADVDTGCVVYPAGGGATQKVIIKDAKLGTQGERDTGFAYSAEAGLFAQATQDGVITVTHGVDTATGSALRQSQIQTDSRIHHLFFARRGKLLLSWHHDATLFIWDTATGAWLARLVPNGEGWAVLDPAGRFDVSSFDEVPVAWASADDPFQVLPLEAYMKEFYQPRLLARILAGEPLLPVPSLAGINRTLPSVRIGAVTPAPGDATRVNAMIEVVEGVASTAQRSGIGELRLFRDSQLVATAGGSEQPLQFDATGRLQVTFDAIRLPRGAAGKEVLFTAYAFNAAGIKSESDSRKLAVPDAPGANAPGGRAYVISMGVNAHTNPDWDLTFAAADARAIQHIAVNALRNSGRYAEVVAMALLSESDTMRGASRNASKAQLKAALANLAVTPDDLVIVTFAGHGHVDGNGNFYLITQDTGSGRGRQITPQLLTAAISSDELAEWLRPIDAGQIVLVIDACHSAAAFEGRDFRPGPIGSRGLGQLSYDKGVRILAGSQADDVALESNRIKGGFLTFALVHEGLALRLADSKPRDGNTMLREWLEYAVERVPRLTAEVIGGRYQGATAVDARGLDIPGERKSAARVIQKPALFDFTPRRADIVVQRVP